MKKILLALTTVLILSQSGWSQVFAPVGAKWYLSQVNWFGPPPIVDTAYVSESLMDTIIDGINCRKVHIICMCCGSPDIYVYDSNDTVYWYNFDLSRFTVLFNFNLNGGDSMYVVTNGFSGIDSILVHIDSTDYITINSQLRKIQYGGGQSMYFWFGGPFVQGVGSLQSIIPQYGTCDPLSGPLRCYEDTMLGLYNTGYRASCDSLYVIFTSVNDIEVEKADINISPNPFYDAALFTIQSKNFDTGVLEVMNISGEAVTAPIHFFGNKIKFERRGLPNGVYFYRITFNPGKLIYGKFVID
jgi:hypothetical protein